MATELFANNPATSLAAGITSGVTSLTVASSTLFPTPVAGTSQFRVLIGSELLIVTAVSGTTWTVTRGAESTAAAAHSSGDPVTHIVTAAALGAFSQGTSTGGGFPLAAGLQPNPIWTTGLWYSSSQYSTSTSYTPASGRLILYPFFVPVDRRIDGLGFNVSTAGAAGATAAAHLYNASGTTTLPTTLFATSGAIAADTTGNKTGLFSAVTISAGIYWIGAVPATGFTVTFTAFSQSMLPIIGGSSTPTTGGSSILVDSQNPAAPGDLSGTTWGTPNQSGGPAVFVRAAA